MSSKNEGHRSQPPLEHTDPDSTARLSLLRADLIASFDASSLSRLEQFVADFDQSTFAWYPSRPALPLTADAAADWVVELCDILAASAHTRADLEVNAHEAKQLDEVDAAVGKRTGILNAALSVIRKSYAMCRNAPSYDTPERITPEEVSAATIIIQKAIAWQRYRLRAGVLGVKEAPERAVGPGAPRQDAKRDLEDSLCRVLLQTGLTKRAVAQHVFNLASPYGLASKSPEAIAQRLSQRRK
jgi:hypothetical protein